MSRKSFILLMLLCLPVHLALAHGPQGRQVSFKASDVEPSAFALKRAKAKGIELKPTPGIDLKGWLFEPAGDGPFPAVVILVSGDGLQMSHRNWGQSLTQSGMVALVIDSFGSRGSVDIRDGGLLNMVDDAISGHRYLSGRDNVAPDRLGLLGFSMGGRYVFNFMDATRPEYGRGRRFEAAVAVYPACSSVTQLSGPMLIIFGDRDEHSSLASCREAVAQSGTANHAMELAVYPGATHFFDNPNYDKTGNRPDPAAPKPIWFGGLDYDKPAHQRAVKQITGFLTEHLKR